MIMLSLATTTQNSFASRSGLRLIEEFNVGASHNSLAYPSIEIFCSDQCSVHLHLDERDAREDGSWVTAGL
jgi:hypothetical protein